ncbi:MULTISPECIES: chaperone modulator CbpM [unclassified Flavobacterium]|uniref:chaperone modulator CbpM n=1 Tax=unclassified Flavobacterium TaxID=196869 RepID=UPI000F0CA28C|nr:MULTISPECIES: chaperone modulator CbpM [unclassified Flavobacterium]AYN03137.1 MerR family transcriptional regulator [Flavobacterium sp. 140616W15]MCD0474963.1 chaperone modulator CbpM [Flavobacterium sp. EDS]
MNNKNLIQIKQFCLYHEIEDNFISKLNDYGLIEIIILKEEQYLQPEQLPSIEKMIRMHYDLKINLEGIDAIAHLLNKIETLQKNLTATQNKLRLFEQYQVE